MGAVVRPLYDDIFFRCNLLNYVCCEWEDVIEVIVGEFESIP